MASCLVLGGRGFIGGHLVDALVDRGHDVTIFDRVNDRKTSEDPRGVKTINGDFLNREDLRAALAGIDYVFHFISTTNPSTSENNPLVDIETNVHMSIELFQECVLAQVKRVIFASTGGAIYGLEQTKPLDEQAPTLPVSPYAIGKLTTEHFLRYFKVKHGLDSITFRISNPYGERQPKLRRQGVIPIFMQKHMNDEELTVLGDGSMVRDYVYVKDVSEIIAQIFEENHHSPVYNLGSGQGVSVMEIVKMIEEISGKAAKVKYMEKPRTFVQSAVLNNDLLIKEFGLSPATSLYDGMLVTWEDIAKN